MKPANLYVDFFVTFILMTICSGETTLTHHKTKAASERPHDLWCHRCDTMADGDRCLEVAAANRSAMHHKCAKEQKKCQVRRISMSTSTDEITGKPKLWLLQRNCSEMCEPGCIVIGERTKLHSCITCCDERNFCNAGGGGERVVSTLSALWLVGCVQLASALFEQAGKHISTMYMVMANVLYLRFLIG